MPSDSPRSMYSRVRIVGLEDLEDRQAAARLDRNQPLRDEVAERRGQARPHGLLVAGVEGADDAVHRFRRVDRVQRREHQVTGLGRGQRDLDRLAIAHLADQDDLRRLAQRRAQRQRKSRRVAVQLALVDRALLVQVQELDRVLDGDDVVGARLVDQVDDRRQRRGLAGAGRAGDQHDTVLQRGDLGEPRRQLQLLERRDVRRNHPHDDREAAALPEHVDAEPRALGQGVGQIAGALIAKRAQGVLVAADEIARDLRPCPRRAASAGSES